MARRTDAPLFAPTLSVVPAACGAYDLPVRIAALLVALALTYGLALPVLYACGIAPSMVGPAAPAVVAVVVAVVACWFAGRGRRELFANIAIVAVLAIVAVALHARFVGGGAALLNQLLMTAGSRTATFDLPFVADESGAVVFASIAAGLLALACAHLALRGGTLVAFALGVCMAVLVALGYVPWTPWLVVLLVGIVGVFVLDVSAANDDAGGAGLATAAVAALVVCALVGGAGYGLVRSGIVDAGGAHRAVAGFIDRARYGDEAWAMPEGQLNGLGPLAASEREALAVQVPGGEFEYLRGFVGETYDNGEWTSLDPQTVTDNQDLFYWLGQDGFSAQSQAAGAAELIGYSGLDRQRFAMTRDGARAGYAYLPYSYSGGADVLVSTDQSTARAVDDTAPLSYDVADGLVRKSYPLQYELAAKQPGAQAGLAAYYDDERAYSAFVHENYLAVPASTVTALTAIAGDPVQLSTEQAKVVVLNALDSGLAYDASAETPNGSTDFVDYTVFESGMGYSVHYATLGTLLMRYYGVPARYVEGYRLKVSDEQYAAARAGTDVADLDPELLGGPLVDEDGTVHLTEQHAHAWVEYYLDGVGWVPFDVTPGFRDDAYFETTPNVADVDDLLQFSAGSSASSQWEPEVAEDQEEQGKDQEELLERLRPSHRLLWFAIGLVIGALAALIVRTVLLRRRLKRLLATFESDEPTDAVPRMFSYAVYLMKRCLGVRFDNAPFPKQAATAADAGACNRDTFLLAAAANDRARFSASGATELDWAAVRRLLDEVQASMTATAGATRKLLWKWLACVWM